MINMMKAYIKIINLILFLFVSLNVYANTGSVTGFELPRFVSLKSNDVNLRVGPSINYPIKLKYIKKNLPVEVIDEYNVWRKIKDHENNIGWIHKSLIKGERNGIIISEINKHVYVYNNIFGRIIGEISIGSIVNLPKCKINWCYITKYNYKGWVKKEYIWGIKDDEVFGIGLYQTVTDYYFKSLTLLENYLD